MGVAWLVVSNLAIRSWVHSPDDLLRWIVIRGWIFVALTGAVLFFSIRYLFNLERKLIIENETRFRLLVDRFPHFVWTLGPTEQAEFFNQRWCEYTGKTQEELLTIDWRDWIHPEDRGIFLEGKAIRSGEFRVRRYDNVYRWHSGILLPLSGPDGQLISWYGSAMDIDDRKHFEDARKFISKASRHLSESLDFLETLRTTAVSAVNGMADWCVACALRGDDSRSESPCVFASRYTDLMHEDVLAEKCLTCVGGCAIEQPGHPIHGAIEEGASRLVHEVTDEFLEKFSCGTSMTDLKALGLTSILIVPIRSVRSSVRGALILCSGPSAKRFTPEDLVVAEDFASRASVALENARSYRDATQAISAREEIIAVVSHDLKNPLNAIRLISELLARSSREGKLPASVLAQSTLISKSVDQMHRLIQSILDLSKLEGGRIRIERKKEDVGHMIDESLEMIRLEASQKSIRLIKTPTSRGHVEILCDHDRMMQVLSNLLGNAIKFTREGGRIQVGYESKGETVLFSVSDNGPGIPARVLPHIFDRYWQARETAQKGTGLGLSIARGFVEAQGGKIWVDSQEGKGTTFYFSFPRVPYAA